MNVVTPVAAREKAPVRNGSTADRTVRRLHSGALAALLVLYASSPWLAMLRRVPREAGLVDYAHLAIGALALLVAVAFLALALRAGRWRLYFPWAAGRGGQVFRDLAGLARGRMPRSEGGGLNTALQGFVLLALFATAATGAGWFLTQGTDAALAWRAVHATCAHVLAGLVIAHAVTALAHVIDLARG
jgi:cytochrome b561